MREFIYLLGCMVVVFLAAWVGAAQPATPVESQGETLVAYRTDNLCVRAMIKTHEVQIGKPSDGKLSVAESSCTYSRYPCSIVDRIEIVVNGNSLFIPRSVFSDLADLSTAKVNGEDEALFLTLHGGDASESYIAKVEFDSVHVKRRVVSSAMSPDEPLQETTYYMRALRN